MRRFRSIKLCHFLIALLGFVNLVHGESSSPAAAYITKLVAAPGSSDLLFAATNGSGLFRSHNAGDTWEQIRPHPELRKFNVVTFAPQDNARLIAGGDESGLWVSDDTGDTWEHVGLGETSILSLVIDPTDLDRWYVLTPNGVHRSTHGPTGPWEHVFNYPEFIAQRPEVWPSPARGVQYSRFQHLTLDPRQPSRLLLGARWEGGYHLSPDGGDTWHHKSIGPIYRRADRVLVDPIDSNILYAETHHQGLFKSYNRGRSWVSSSHGIAPQKRTPHYGAVLISGTAFDPANPQTLYAGSDYSNWKSTDAGVTWTELDPSLTCEFARSFLVTGKAVYAGTNVGIYRSFDGGDSWESCNRGLPTRELITTATGTVNGERWEFAITSGRPAVYRRSLDHPSDWTSISWLLYEPATAVRFETDSETLVIDTPAGKRRSQDGGLRWDGPATVFIEKRSTNPEPTPPARTNQYPVAIHGTPPPDDSLIDAMYQRPPYVAFAIVGPDYPEDGSEPLLTGSWEDHLSGTITISPQVLKSESPKILRVEVRDFQYGTRTGETPLNLAEPMVVKVATALRAK